MKDTSEESNASTPPKRVLLKVSGEALAGEQGFGVDSETLANIGKEIADVANLKVGVGVVIGGGNFFRGATAAAAGMDRVNADYMGMLATIMNALAVQQSIKSNGVACRVLSALPITPVAEPYVRGRAIKHLDLGRVVVFGGGTGNPLFTTDSAAALRAIEIGADLMIKATKVDGVYDSDPVNNPDAQRYDELTFKDVLKEDLKVMDAAAISLCREHNLPIRVVDIGSAGAMKRIVSGESVGTIIR